MDIIRCPHCGVRVVPSSDGECPSCRRPTAAISKSASADADEPLRRLAVIQNDPAWQFRTLSYLLGGSWGIFGVCGVVFSTLDSRLFSAVMWGLMPVALGILICLKQVWAVRVGLVISYWLILHSVFILHSFPPLPFLAMALLAHSVLNRAAKMRTQDDDDTKVTKL